MTTTTGARTAAGTGPRPGRGRALRRNRDSGPAMLMAAPAVLGLIAFVAVPFIVALVLSFYDAQLNQVRAPKFFGLTQYVRLFTDRIVAGPFLRSLLNNLVFAVVVIPVQTAISLGLAILLNSKLKGIPAFRTIFFMPVVFPMALVAVIWRLVLDRSGSGLLNAFMGFVSAGHLAPQDWLGSGATAMGAVILLSIWQGAGFQMVIILAGLQEIPVERYEAASLDRASPWQQFVHVTLPGLRNTLIFVVLYTTILAFQVYDQVYILIKTAGGNQTALQTVLYQGTSSLFDGNNLGRAAAITVVFFAIVLVIAVVQRSLLKQRTEE